jgi:putative ABC transport system permease protein
MLCKRYSWLVLISFTIAAPFAGFLGWYTITSLYADHTDIHWWIFPLTLVLVGSVMLGTIALQSWRAARETPVNSIKSE